MRNDSSSKWIIQKRAAPTCVESVIELIGGTPMVELKRLVQQRGLRGKLFAKLEYLNPGFSQKDRIALEIVQSAKASGLLQPGQTVIELTSGNTGAGLAIVCRALGHPFIAVMSKGNSVERAQMMRALGAKVVLADQSTEGVPNQVSGEDLALAERRMNEIATELGAFRSEQFCNEANAKAHEKFTGPEIWEQTNGRVDVFLHFVGTSGSFAGATRFLKTKNPKLRAYVVEPHGAAALAGEKVSSGSHRIQGGGYSRRDLELLDRAQVDGFLKVTDEQAIAGARLLAAEEGIFAGFSSGAHVAAAIGLLQEREAGANIVFLACDSGLKYCSTELFV